jgi:uncharacterized protein YndB with AHSA1/START domain
MAPRLLGTTRTTPEGDGAIRIQERVQASATEVWAALTDPARLGRWLGEVEGDLRAGGEFRARFFASGWEGTGRIEACEPPRRLAVVTRDVDDPTDHAGEVTLTREGEATVVSWEERGMPAELVAAYAAGVQIHVEDLATYLAGGERIDAAARFGELFAAYREAD